MVGDVGQRERENGKRWGCWWVCAARMAGIKKQAGAGGLALVTGVDWAGRDGTCTWEREQIRVRGEAVRRLDWQLRGETRPGHEIR